MYLKKKRHHLDKGCPTCGPLNVFMWPTTYSNFLVIFLYLYSSVSQTVCLQAYLKCSAKYLEKKLKKSTQRELFFKDHYVLETKIEKLKSDSK